MDSLFCVNRALAEAFCVSFWMRKFGHSSMKRSLVLGNTRHICRLDRGKLTRRERETASKAAKITVDRNGRRGFQGTRKTKESQKLAKVQEPILLVLCNALNQ